MLEHEIRSAGWSVRYCQLQPGSLKIRAKTINYRDLTLHRVAANLRLEIEGSALDDRLSVFMSRAGSGVWVNERVADKDSLVIVRPGAQVLIVTPARSECILVRIDWKRLKGLALGTIFKNGSDVVESPVSSRIRRDLRSPLRSAFRGPSGRAPGPGTDTELIPLLTELAKTPSDKEPDLSAEQWRVLLVSRKLISTNLAAGIRVQDLCQSLAVSRSKLERLFRSQIGVSPLKYITMRRLADVRRALKRCEPDSQCVAIVARRHGFRHLGRFSIAYRNQFGELPSETLRQN